VALRVSSFALALLLAGAEPEELATGVAASLRHAPGVAFGDVIGANVASEGPPVRGPDAVRTLRAGF
jgi:hypothetical protein